MDAVDLVRVVTLLAVNASGKLEKVGEATVRFRMLPLNVTNDPAKIDAKLFLFTLGTFDLTGMTIATIHDQGFFAEPLEALAKFNAMLLCQSYQDSSGLVVELGVGWKGYGLLLEPWYRH